MACIDQRLAAAWRVKDRVCLARFQIAQHLVKGPPLLQFCACNRQMRSICRGRGACHRQIGRDGSPGIACRFAVRRAGEPHVHAGRLRVHWREPVASAVRFVRSTEQSRIRPKTRGAYHCDRMLAKDRRMTGAIQSNSGSETTLGAQGHRRTDGGRRHICGSVPARYRTVVHGRLNLPAASCPSRISPTAVD